MSDDKDIAKVRSADRRRGKKTPDNLQRKRERLEALLLAALRNGDRKLFEETLIDLGQPVGSEQHKNSMKLFDDEQK